MWIKIGFWFNKIVLPEVVSFQHYQHSINSLIETVLPYQILQNGDCHSFQWKLGSFCGVITH